MTDVRTLLRAASPPPPPTVGINRVLDAARTRQRSRRRWLAWIGGLLVLGTGGSVTTTLVNASRPPTHVDNSHSVRRDDAPTATTLVATAHSQVPAAPGGAAETPTQASHGATAPSSATPAEGCRVDERSTSNVQLSDGGQGGAGWDGYPSCSYAATVAAGYAAKGSWRIEITRDGTRFTLDSADSPACAKNVVHAGDSVTVYLRKGVNSPADWFIEVGPNAGCAT